MASFDSFEEIHHQAPHGSFVEIEDEMDFSNFSSYSNVNPGPDDEDEVIPVPVSSQDAFGFGSSMDSSPFAPIHENGHNNDYGSNPDGPILPPPSEMGADEGYALREWRRQNAAYLQEKEVTEKQMRVQIIKEGEEYIKAFYEKRHLNIETNKVNNREREKLYAANQEKFHKEAGNQYWKTIAELIPNEVPNIEKKGRKKEQEKKPSITVIQGPKPGKPTDLSRMRHILLKLKHAPPPHMVAPPPTKEKDAKGGKGESSDGSPAKVLANGSVDTAKPDGSAAPSQPTGDAAKNASV